MWIKSGCLGKGLCVSVGTSISVFLNKKKKKRIYIEKNALFYFKPQTVCFNLIKTRKTNKVLQQAAESLHGRVEFIFNGEPEPRLLFFKMLIQGGKSAGLMGSDKYRRARVTL